MSRYDSTNDTKLATRVDCPVFCASVTSPPRGNGTTDGKKPGNCRFFLTPKRFESQDFAGPLVAIARRSAPPPQASTVSLPVFCGPELGWRVEDRHASRRGGSSWPTTGVCTFVVGNLTFYGDAVLDYRDDGLGRLWLEKFGADANQQPSIRNGRILDTGSLPATQDRKRISNWEKPRPPSTESCYFPRAEV